MGPELPSPDHRERLRALDALRRPVWVFDPHSLRGVYANAAALKLWGADTVEELLSRDFSKLSPAARARTDRLAKATATGGEVLERWTFYPNGAPVTVQATISTCTLADGRPALLFEASPLEVETEERRAVEALRHTSALITLFDGAGCTVFSNPAAYSTYGLDAASFEARFADHGLAAAVFDRALSGATVAEVCGMVTMEGPRWHRLDARPVFDPVTGAAGVLLNEVDVTNRVRAEQARAAAEQKAAMVEARQLFLTEMSHELRTPLNAVIGFSELLKAAALAPHQIDQASRIHDSGRRLLAIVNEMIRLSELEGWAAAEGEVAPAETVFATAPGDVAGPSPEGASDRASELRPLRVLYVDDNDNNRTLVVTILATQGIECLTAEDGLRGAEAAGEGPWDLILMDIQMPVMDGVEATRAIRASALPARSIPIVAVTANTQASQLETYFEAGMNDYIAKPIDAGALLTRVFYWGDAVHHT